jgi:hypothetical protein
MAGKPKLFSCAFAALTLIAMDASAQNFPGGPGVIKLQGKCEKLVVGKVDASKGCAGELGSVTAPDGTVTFIFTSQGKMLGFGGDGGSVRAAGAGAARLVVGTVSTGVGTKITGEVDAPGFCTFGNPYSGKPITIECTAKSKDSTFTGTFKTSGKAPAAPAPAKAPAKKK